MITYTSNAYFFLRISHTETRHLEKIFHNNSTFAGSSKKVVQTIQHVIYTRIEIKHKKPDENISSNFHTFFLYVDVEKLVLNHLFPLTNPPYNIISE